MVFLKCILIHMLTFQHLQNSTSIIPQLTEHLVNSLLLFDLSYTLSRFLC